MEGALPERRVGRVHVHALRIALGLGVVGPDRVPAVLANQAIVRLLVDERPGRRVERVVKVVGAVRRRRRIESVDRVQGVVVVELARNRRHAVGSGLVQRPDRDHRVDVRRVQLPHDRSRVREPARVHEVRAPHGGAPVLPVLDDDVDRDVVVAIAVLNRRQLGRALIVVFRLEQAVGPLGKQRRRAGGGPVVRDHLIDGGAVEEVVVDQIARFGAEAVAGVAADVAGEVRDRIVVPEETVALVRDQDRNLNLGVGVEHPQRRSLAVDHAVLVLAEAKQRFVGRVLNAAATVLVATPSTVAAARLLLYSETSAVSFKSV